MKAMLSWLFDGVGEPTPPARVLARIRAQQERSEILVSLAQLLLVVFFAALYHVAPMAHGSLQAIDIIRGVDLIDGILAIYATLTLIRLGLALGHMLRPWMLFASVVLDIALLMAVIWSFHLKYGQPPGFYLKAPTFAYVFILIALRALRFEVRFVLFAGAMAVVGWLVLVAFASGVTERWGYNVGRPPGCEAHPCRTRDYVEYVRTDFILYGAEVDRIVTITVVTLVLALAIARARRLLIRAAAEQVAARDLSRFLAPEVAERIRRSEMAIAPGEGELRDAAILTTDLRGFTRLSLSMEPDAVMRLLQEYQSRVCPAILAAGGSIDKFLGDGILSSFGAARPGETYAADALRAADAVLAAIAAWNVEREAAGQAIVRVGLAIASGRVIFGAVGDGDRLEYTVIGDAVNLAAKLEKHTKDEGVRALTDAATYDLAAAQGYVAVAPVERRAQRAVAGVAAPLDLVILAA
ncbi:MAG: adenylate/guanylate cyclase domain-containing protein [Reyranellaceae bacterium]